MTVTSDDRVAVYDGDGVSSEFPVTFGFFEIEVVVGGVVQTHGVNYEISQTAPGRTGSVIFTAGSIPPAGTGNVQIRGNTTIEQSVDYTENNEFPAETVERALDRLTMIAGEFNRRVLQSLRNVPLGDEIPALDFAANPLKVIRVDADGVPALTDPAFLTDAIYTSLTDARDAALAAQAAAETAETNAETAETNAEAAETNAETAEANAATSATNAANSATAAAGSASAASSSATNAAASATDASDSAAAAAASALAAASSEAAAATSEMSAATSATNAASSASSAATSATNAANSATAAATAETNAETAETNAEAAQAAAEAAQAAAEAAVASINMPVINPGDAGKAVVAKDTEDGYVLANISRVGELTWLTATAVPSGVPAVIANGASLSRTTYAALWAFAQSSGNLAASQGAKQDGQYGPGDGSTTFTIPDLVTDGRFIRAKTASAAMGAEQEDAFQGHRHNTAGAMKVAVGAVYNNSPRNEGGQGLDTGDPISDGTNGAPRTANETRPKNVSLIPILFYR
jgi:chemotaxis protein histidine kinase CheA